MTLASAVIDSRTPQMIAERHTLADQRLINFTHHGASSRAAGSRTASSSRHRKVSVTLTPMSSVPAPPGVPTLVQEQERRAMGPGSEIDQRCGSKWKLLGLICR